MSYGSETDTLTHNELSHRSTGLSECIEGIRNCGEIKVTILVYTCTTQYKKNCHFDFMFVTSQLKGIVVLNASMTVCY